MELDLLKKLALTLALGMLVGMEREFSQRREGEPLFAGARTFTLLALLGLISGYLAFLISPIIMLGAFLIVGILVVLSYFLSVRAGGHFGTTTEVAALLTFLIGVLVSLGKLLMASVVAIIIVTFLALKSEFRGFAGKLNREDIYATLKFAIITVIILPFLPNRPIGPLAVFNPYEIWLLVILVSGISFAGYVLVKIIGPKRSAPLIGLLGGLASSTAVTASFSQQSKQNAELSRVLAFGAVLASTTMLPRLVIALAVVNPGLLPHLAVPIASMAIAGMAAAGWLWRLERHRDHATDVQFINPFAIIPALKFAVLFVVILFVAKAALDFIGTRALYVTALIAGLTDVDAITLTTARLARQALDHSIAKKVIILAAMSNTIMKGSIALLFGAKLFGRQMASAL
ncbi:MAG: MgtC/SapB family protein, partial [candidate division KSB1 bacterium]|nr:MgtC/SapB family protein [candidate division KSB1 bacterium]